ncbi:unnamed protein product [Brachionus calyciflorus]|uniref:Uncharacterized protein n=1 Tax=Brachionus calyciflorus TaxID=104777 RepID=A0A813ZQ45_9BILA|nr:unnamed protein product [Brachionus calyciflorus]
MKCLIFFTVLITSSCILANSNRTIENACMADLDCQIKSGLKCIQNLCTCDEESQWNAKLNICAKKSGQKCKPYGYSNVKMVSENEELDDRCNGLLGLYCDPLTFSCICNYGFVWSNSQNNCVLDSQK